MPEDGIFLAGNFSAKRHNSSGSGQAVEVDKTMAEIDGWDREGKLGWYSAQDEAWGRGHTRGLPGGFQGEPPNMKGDVPCIYLTTAGRRVKVTEITAVGARPIGNFPDFVCVGPVTHCLRTSRGEWNHVEGVPYGPQPGDELL